MLGSILINDHRIVLSDPKSGLQGIYDVDSLSLLIGENGSGKTHALCEIIRKFTSYEEKYYSDSCRVYDIDDIEQMDYELREWGVVYFTSLPFRPNISAKTPNFINASPRLNNNNSAFNILEYKNILDDFGMSPRFRVHKKINLSRVFLATMDLLSPSAFKISNVFLKNMSLIKRLREDIETLKNDKLNANVKNSIRIKQRDIYNILSTSEEQFFSFLSKKFSDDLVFSVFAVLEHEVTKKDYSKDNIVNLLEHFFKISNSSHTYSTENNQDIIDDALHLIDFFRQRNEPSKLSKFKDSNGNYYMDFLASVDSYDEKSIIDGFMLSHLLSLEFTNVSSGELALLNQVIRISESIKKLKNRKNGTDSILLLIDEGDAFLHLQWQQKYIATLNKFLGKLKVDLKLNKLQVVLATHSPLLTTDVPVDFICRLDKGIDGHSSGFAAPLYALLSDSFNTNSIGEFAATHITEIFKRASSKKVTKQDLALIKKIDNSIIRTELERLINKNTMEE